MKSNKVGAYQQLNEMWYQDINQALGDFNEAKVIDSINEEEAIEEQDMEMEEGKKKLAFVIPCPDAYDIEEEAEHFQYLLDKAGVKAKVKANQVGEEAEVYTKDEKKARKVIEKNGYQIGWTEDNELEEKGDVKSIGDAGKMAHANTRTNLARHRSSDMLDKISKKDHDKNTVVGAKAAAYKAPHMKEGEANDTLMAFATKVSDEINDAYQDKFDSKKANIDQEEYTPEEMYKYISEWAESNDLTPEEAIKEFNWRHLTQELGLGLHEDMENDISNIKEAEDDIFAGSDTAKWDNYGNETSEWDTEIAGQTVKGWTAEETQGGAIAWQNPKYPNAHIYATPGWEGVDGIAFELHDSEDGYMDEPKIQKVIGSGTEAWKTKKGYMALMAKAFTVVEKMLIPSDNMDEDHGMQVNHDMNDDISMDYTEPERMVQNEDEDPFGSIKTGIDKITRDDDEDFIDDDKLDRFYEMGGRQLTKAADALLDDGFSKREIIDYLQNYM
jgi:hypothetical protein